MWPALPFAPDGFHVRLHNIPDGRNDFRKPEESGMSRVTVFTPVPESVPITGAEAHAGEESGFKALVQFYRAFNARDLPAMQDNWLNADEIAMDNPLGGIWRGWTEIRGVYERLFSGPARVYVEFYDYTLHETPEMFYAVGRERGHFKSAGESLALAIRTSLIFRRTRDGWRQVHHHGSIDDPGLLARYQHAVPGR
jgi:ketosteroid isomerase-like protein